VTPKPEAISAENLRAGLTAEYEREISESDVLNFAANCGDFNPLHVDQEFAQQSRFSQRIVHGAFQIGLASALIGMHLPGRDVLLGSVHARFLAPLYYPSRVKVAGEITAWNLASRSGSLRVTVRDAASLVPVSEITLAFTLQGSKPEKIAPAARSGAERALPQGRKVVLLTGASGGIGSAVLRALAGGFVVLALIHRRPLSEEMRALPQVVEVQADFNSHLWEQVVEEQLGGRPLFGIVHAAWAGLPRGGLLNCDAQLIGQQLSFGTSLVVRLARLLFAHADADGGRFVALGSTAGHHKPALGLGAYSLAKAALEDTVRLLAPELARKRISINAVCPALVPTGMNAEANDLQMKREAAAVPLGRVCATDDVMGAIHYLLSAEASFVSGQSIVLSGAQL
jgi:NAD(P)-dependent dehydrogenase (short-subunit alcohol dehydrogenase family)/acyl dehydratase